MECDDGFWGLKLVLFLFVSSSFEDELCEFPNF